MLKSKPTPSTDPASATARPVTQVHIVTRKDLPLCCPMPGAAVWDMHPRVYLPIADDPNLEATCPYCGARYRLET
jgi:uncharacterized Zn-finger protein